MASILYVFIDESGEPTHDDYYGLAGCWCVSREGDFTKVLDPTVQRLLDVAEATYRNPRTISELKGADLATDVLEVVVDSLPNVAFDDTTIQHTGTPWGVSHPVRYTVSTVNPATATTALTNAVGNQPDSANALKLMMLISILDPIFREGVVNPEAYTKVEVILDAEVWTGPAEHAEEAVTETTQQNQISFSTEDSKRTPGLQLADIGVYSWCRHQREGDAQEVVENIDTYRFAEE